MSDVVSQDKDWRDVVRNELRCQENWQKDWGFLADNGILDELEKLHIGEGDTVRMYGYSFEYYRNADTKPVSEDEDEEE